MKRQILFALLFPVLTFGKTQNPAFREFLVSFVTEYNALQIPAFTFDYKEYFSSIPSTESLGKQKEFFKKTKKALVQFKDEKLTGPDQAKFMQISYEVTFNLRRIELEQQWVGTGRKMSDGGLHELSNSRNWYAYFVKKYTSLDKGPEEIMEFGKKEVKRVQEEIRKIRMASGFTDSLSFYAHLKDSSFYITEKQRLLKAFAVVDSTVRSHIEEFTGSADVPPVYPMEWPDAGPNTPPGIYLNHRDNAYGKDVFQINFYGKKFNKRSMEWLYMHEAIPGHHLQFTYNKFPNELDDLFIYPGNFEGWGCYIEYFGKDLGLYKDPYAYLGKWEWDLVRSARLVIDAGIHYYGWTYEQAMKYWKDNIPGQNDIADREITRVTNWPAQALSYKIGAEFIYSLKGKWLKQNPDQPISKFNRTYIESGRLPLSVMSELLLKAKNNGSPQLIYEEEGKESAYPRLSKDNKEILFQSNRAGKWQLYIYEILNKKLIRISNDTFNNNFPDWSQDNKWIAFVSDRDGNEEIYMARTDGSSLKRITIDNARDIHPYFSPDGKFILFNSTRGNGSLDIYRFTISSGKTERLTNTNENETCARYSPDMRQIVFLKNSISIDDVFLLNLSTGLTENVSKTPKTQDGWPMFSPDGKWIYFSSLETGTYCIWKMKTDGKERKQLTFAEEGKEDARVYVSSNGKYFIYNERSGTTISIWRSG
jgi:Tol biopolymer transport system component